ncbi:MAG TPA: protein translocase subunit SecD [Caulobacteraceae bacterium]|nr:protein translocase subunit SecD [Caulobacteraceae bacterium]
MLALPRWKVALCVLAVLFGLVFTAPNLIPQQTLDSLPGWLPKSKLNLGLDLQGGSYLLLEVDTDSLKAEKLNNLVEDARTTLSGKSIATTALGLNGAVVTVRLADAGQSNAAYQALSQVGDIQTSGAREVSVQTQPGGVITLSLSDQALAEDTSKAVDQSIEIIRRRVDALGTREPSITRQGLNRIVVEAPGESDPEKLKAVIGQTAKLTFQMVDDGVSQDDLQAGRIPPDDVQLPSEDSSGPLVVKRRAVVTGEMLTDATQGFDQTSGAADVNFRFNGVGTQRFGEVTAQNIGKRFAIVLDNKIVSAPVIQGAIAGGSGQITGNFTPESANQLAIVLRSGALPAKLNPIEQRSVGAELGADAVRAGQISAVLGFVVILVFIVLAYGLLFGGIAVAALSVNGLLLIAAMSLTQATLTLPGVAGMILSLALAVDASVLIYERIRDEARAGHAPLMAADHGFQRALISIMDANVTTLIAGAIMFQFGAGPVRGFAWSLSIGVFTSVFSAVVISQVLLGWWFRRTKPKTLPIINKDGHRGGWPLIKWVPAQTHFKFTRLAPFAAAVSGLLVLASVGSVATIGLNLGTDFAGGTVIEISTPGPAPLGALRAELNRSGVNDPSVQGFGSPNAALLRFKTPNGQDAMGAANTVKLDLAKTFPGIQITRVEVVGPKVSGELVTSGLMALGIAIGLMLLYIWFRFQLQFGLGAVIAIFHDLILTVGMLAVLHIEFSMTSIAALLTIIGYSMNEKVITFDRLRENLRKYKRTSLRDIIDLSENERLSRTLITGSTALLALAGMLFMGGPALFPLVFAMVFGIFVGTYSSIYVALPIILVWGVKRGDEAEPAPGAKAAVPRP